MSIPRIVSRPRTWMALAAAAFLWPTLAHGGIVGRTWTQEAIGLTLRLEADGSFVMQYPGGTSGGSYTLEGDVLITRAAGGGQQVYQVSQPDPDTLVLTDLSGGSLLLRAEPGGGAAGRPGPAPTDTLARAGELELTRTKLEPLVRLVEMVIDQAVSPEERERITRAAAAEFRANPRGFLQQCQAVDQAIQTLGTLQDPFQLGLARQMLFAGFYLASLGAPQDRVPEVVKVMLEHVRVVAVDPAAQLVMTDRDLDALVAYDGFVSQVLGAASPGFSAVPRDQLEGALASQFASLPTEVKQSMVAVYPVWQATREAWGRLTSEQQQMVVAQVRAQLARQQVMMMQQSQAGQGQPMADMLSAGSGVMMTTDSQGRPMIDFSGEFLKNQIFTNTLNSMQFPSLPSP